MRFTLLANLAAFALFAALSVSSGLCRWEALLFQLVLQGLTNEFWMDLFILPFRGQHLFGGAGEQVASPARIRRVARWSAVFVLLFPALVCGGLAGANLWGEGALASALRLPLDASLFLPVCAAQGLLLFASLLGGLVPLSYRSVVEALMARRERRLLATVPPAAPMAAPPTRAGVGMLPHGLPEGVVLPDCLKQPQPCSPLHARHAAQVRELLHEGERVILSTAPAGVVPLPASSNERTYGSLGLCLAAALLYVAFGMFEQASAHEATRWVVLLLGLGLLPASLRLLRAAARRQSLLRRTDYFVTNKRLHICRAGRWQAVDLVSMEVLAEGEYGEGRGNVELCPESGPEVYQLVNVECAQELCVLLERLIYMENAR